MLEVYRVEHKDTGTGPFQTNDPFTQKMVEKLFRNLHVFPNPGDDGLGLGDIPFWFVFGCPSIETMKQWILLGDNIHDNDAIVKTLDEKGFILKYHLVEEDWVRKGWSGHQVAFGNKDDHICVSEQLSITTLMREAPMMFCLR